MSSSDGTRFSEYTPTDHQAPLWIATALTLAYAGLFLIVRFAIKIKVLALDDVFLSIAHVLAFVQWGIMFAGLDKGVGKSIPGIEQTDVAKLVFISRILTLLVVGFSKCSVFLFLRQLFAGTASRGWNICSFLLIGAGCWTVGSALTVSISCTPSGALLLETSAGCADDLTRWKVVTALDACFEIVLVVLPIVLFYSVQISRAQRFTIFGVFFPRIAVPAIFIAYLEAYINFRQDGGTSISSVRSLVLQQVLCGYTLVSATTPCLNSFLKQFRTHDLAKLTTEGSSGTRTNDHNSGSRSHAEAYTLESLDHRKNKSNVKLAAANERPPAALACRPGELPSPHSANAFTEIFSSGDNNGDGRSVKSYGSERMMIHRKVEFGVASS